ncbi:MAG: TraR/DksA family transcriptional regulator [Aquificae bacterium]|nr:TraR/DksA family transcriptional regulator [Aquificota bacterium]
MDKEFLKKCEKRLLEEKAKILGRYREKEEIQERLGEESREPRDLEDIGQITYTEELLDNLSQVEMQTIREIEYALEKINKGIYGMCEGCGEQIPEARLCAIPWTRYCAKCAEEMEKETGTYMPSYGVTDMFNIDDIKVERDDIGEA